MEKTKTIKPANVHDLPPTPTMADIEAFTKQYSDARAKVSERVQTMNDEIEQVKRKHMRFLKQDVAGAKEKQNTLADAIGSAADLFDKPKSHIFHGIKVGFRKLVGKLSWDDDDKVCERIQKNFPEKYDALVKVTRKPIDKSLKALPGEDLLKLGVTLGKDTDDIVVASVDTEVDKIVEAFLKDGENYD